MELPVSCISYNLEQQYFFMKNNMIFITSHHKQTLLWMVVSFLQEFSSGVPGILELRHVDCRYDVDDEDED